MTADRWDQIVDLFSMAVDRTRDQQAEYLDLACALDADLRADVEQLLANHGLAETEDFLREPPWVIDEIPVLLPDFEEFTQIEYLDHGGMGVVYQTFDKNLDTRVALKMSLPRRLTTTEDISRFRIDPQTMAKLRHPNIVQVHKVGEFEGKPYFTMNLIERSDGLVSLAKHVARLRDDPAAAAKLMIKVARAVDHAHQRGILHRDLKPGNILLDDFDTPYVTDFGLAMRTEKEVGLARMSEMPKSPSTSHRGIVGTVSYMSPEQADENPEREVTTLSDVYGLGATLYTLLTGGPPFQTDSLRGTLQLTRDTLRKPQAPRQLNPRLDRIIEAICMKSLEKDPNCRYHSAEALARNLERWLRHEDVDPLQPTWVRCWNWFQRNPGVASLTVAAVMLLILSAVMANLAARNMERKLTSAALRSSSLAGERVADEFRWLLREVSRHVSKAADDENVQMLLGSTQDFDNEVDVKHFLDTEEARELHHRLEERFREYNADLDIERIPPFATMFFLNSRGRLVDLVAPPTGNSTIIGRALKRRDYFEAAKSNARAAARSRANRGVGKMEAVHISRVYKSEYDGLFKFSISAPVVADDGTFLGAIQASIRMGDTLGLTRELLYSQEEKVVLVGRVDPSANLGYEYHVLLHEVFGGRPELGRQEFPFNPTRRWPLTDPLRPQLSSRPDERIDPDDQYIDPFAIHDNRYKGRWLASFAQVGNTELMVIVQQKYDDAIGQPTAIAKQYVWWGWSSLALAFVLAGVVVWRRSQRPDGRSL